MYLITTIPEPPTPAVSPCCGAGIDGAELPQPEPPPPPPPVLVAPLQAIPPPGNPPLPPFPPPPTPPCA